MAKITCTFEIDVNLSRESTEEERYAALRDAIAAKLSEGDIMSTIRIESKTSTALIWNGTRGLS